MGIVLCLFFTPGCVSEGVKADNFIRGDYGTALKKAIVFYDANKCGKEVKTDNVFPWRGECHLSDGEDVGLDLTGGFHDAGGLKFLHSWGVLRYAAAEAMCALLYYKQTGDERLKAFAKSQIDYILGKNPEGISYIIGFGSHYPAHPHHRAASMDENYILEGALVGGPDEYDVFEDDIELYMFTEVAIDYNAGLVGALAGMTGLY